MHQREHANEKLDVIGIAVDWLDACRARSVESIVALYAPDATIECGCNCCSEPDLIAGERSIRAFWHDRLAASSDHRFELFDVEPERYGVTLIYGTTDGRRIRELFRFDQNGKIVASACEIARTH